MSDETTQFIVGDAAIEALSQPPRRRFFRRKSVPEKKLTRCENCGAALSGPYCAVCGQHAIDYRRSLMQVMIDAADSFFDWDTKFLRSLVVLLVRPWRLTNDFNAGRRVRYMHPLRLYFLASIVFFLMAKLINLAPSGAIQMSPEDRAEIDASLAQLTGPDSPLPPEQRAKVEEARARFLQPNPALSDDERSKLDRLVTRLPRFAKKKKLEPTDLAKLDLLLNRIPGAPASPSPGSEIAPPFAQPSAPPQPSSPPLVQFDHPDAKKDPLGAWMEERIKEKVGADGTKAELFFDTLRSNIPTMMLFCIPLFAFILKILYLFQRRFYIEHLVYALHIHAFAYMAAVVITFIGMGLLRVLPALQPVVVTVLSLAAAALVFLSIRRVYGQGWSFTTFKFFLGAILYLVVLAVGIGATAFVTLLLPS